MQFVTAYMKQSILKPIWHHDRRGKRPAKDAIAHPSAYNLHPAGPIGPAYWYEITLLDVVIAANVLCEECCYPSLCLSRQYIIK